MLQKNKVFIQNILPERGVYNDLLLVLFYFLISKFFLIMLCSGASILQGKENLNLLVRFQNWDAVWYAGIAENGYMTEPIKHAAKDAANWAFMPLYPVLVNMLSRLTGLSIMASGILIASFCHYAMGVYALKYLHRVFPNNDQHSLLMVLFFSPLTIYYTISYPNSLFALLIFMFFYYLQTNSLVTIAVVGALASATRQVGVFLFIPFFIYIMQTSFGKITLVNIYKTIWHILKRPKLLLTFFALPSGLFVYITYLYFYIGDGFAFLRIQRAWGWSNVDYINCLAFLANMLHAFASPTNFKLLFLIAMVLFYIWFIFYGLFIDRYPELIFILVCMFLSFSRFQNFQRHFAELGISALLIVYFMDSLQSEAKSIFKLVLFALNVILTLLWLDGSHTMI